MTPMLHREQSSNRMSPFQGVTGRCTWDEEDTDAAGLPVAPSTGDDLEVGGGTHPSASY